MASASLRVALVCALVLVAGAGGGVGEVQASASQPLAVYVGTDGTASVLSGDGSTTSTGVDADVVGPMADFDGDNEGEAPVVDGSGTLSLVGTDGTTQTLVTGDVASSKTYLPNGDWDGDGTLAVFYENTSDGNLYRVEPGASPEPVVGPDGTALATNAPVGVADYDGDGDTDVVFLGGSSTVKYYDGESVESTGFSSFGTNNGLGIGAPADFDGDGTPRVPYVTGSNNLALLAADGTKTKVTPNYGGAVKAPVAGGDWTGDSGLELLHVNADNGEIHYATLSGDVGPVETPAGGTVGTTAVVGVMPTTTPPAPTITDFAATNPSGQNVTVEFTSSDPLTDIAVELTGPENATLTESAFTERGDGPYRYAATDTVTSSGTYTATLTRAVNEQGVDGSEGETDSVSVETAAPTVTDVAISDADGNGVVGDGDWVDVTASVESENDLGSVTANASAFGAGTVSLQRTASGYHGQFTVQVDAMEGAQTVRVTATDESGNSDSATSGTLVVDTTPPTADAGDDQTVAAGTTANFDAADSADNTRIVRYTWAFGDGTSTDGVTAAHTYDETGMHTVSLTVTDAANHTATDSTTIRVVEETATVTASPKQEATPAPTSTATATDGGDADESTPAATDGGDGGNSTSTRASPATDSDVAVTRGDGRSVTVTFSNLSASQPVSANYRALAPLNDSIPIQGIRFVPERDGNVSMTVSGRDEPPADVPALSSRPGVTAIDYVRLDHSIANEEVHGVAFTLVVPKHRVGNASAVTLYRYQDGDWTPHETARVGETRNAVTYRVRVPGLSVFGVGVQRHEIRVVEAGIGDSSPTVGDTVPITATVVNDGQAPGTRRVSLIVDGSVVATRNVSMAPGERRTVGFDYEPTQTGDYRVRVENASAGTLSVGASATAGAWGAWPRWPFAFVVVALAFAGGYAARRRREPTAEVSLAELPEAQRRTLITAYEAGYFDVPRSASLAELGDWLDCSEQDVSLQLRRGLDTLLAESLAGENYDAGTDDDADSERRSEPESAGEPDRPWFEPERGGVEGDSGSGTTGIEWADDEDREHG